VLLQAEHVEPENHVPPALLGDLAARRGNTTLAAFEYRRAVALNPKDPDLQPAGPTR
jgi:Flp pilus assembly protein TadD